MIFLSLIYCFRIRNTFTKRFMEFNTPGTTEYALTYRPEFHDFTLEIMGSMKMGTGNFVNIRGNIVTMAKTPLYVKIARFPNGSLKIFTGNQCFEGHENVILADCKNVPSQFFNFEGGCIFCDENDQGYSSSTREYIHISYSSTSSASFSRVSQQDIKREVITNSQTLLNIQRNVNFDTSSNLNLSADKAFNLSVDKDFDVSLDKSLNKSYEASLDKSMGIGSKTSMGLNSDKAMGMSTSNQMNAGYNNTSETSMNASKDGAYDLSEDSSFGMNTGYNNTTGASMNASKDSAFDLSKDSSFGMNTHSSSSKARDNTFHETLNGLSDIDLNRVLSSKSWNAFDVATKKSIEKSMAANEKKSIDAAANKIGDDEFKQKLNLKENLNLNTLSNITNLKDVSENLNQIISSNVQNDSVTQHHADLNNSLSENLDVLNTSLIEKSATKDTNTKADINKSLESTQAINNINLNNSLSGILNNTDSKVTENLNHINTNLLSAILNNQNVHLTDTDIKNMIEKGGINNDLLRLIGQKDLSKVLDKRTSEKHEKKATNVLSEILTSKNKQDIANSLSEAINTTNVNKILESIKNNENKDVNESIIADLHNYKSSNSDVKESANNLEESLVDISNNQIIKENVQQSNTDESKENMIDSKDLINSLKKSSSSETFKKVLDAISNKKDVVEKLRSFVGSSGTQNVKDSSTNKNSSENENKESNNITNISSKDEKSSVSNTSNIIESGTSINSEDLMNKLNELSKKSSNITKLDKDLCIGKMCFKINKDGEVIEAPKFKELGDTESDAKTIKRNNEISDVVEKNKKFGMRDALKLIPEATTEEKQYEKLEKPVIVQQETRENEDNDDLFKSINLQEVNTIKPKKIKIQEIKIMPATHYSVQKVKVLPKKTIKIQDINVKKKHFNVMDLKLLPKKKIEIQDVVTYRKPIIEKLPPKKVMITDVTECPEKKVQQVETKKMEDKEFEVVDVKNIPAKKIEITEIKKLPKKVIELENNFEYEDKPISDEEIRKVVADKVKNVPIEPAIFTKNVVVEGDKQKTKFTVNGDNEVKIDVKDKN